MEYATAIGMTTALVQVIKSTINLESKYTPILSLIVGLVMGYIVGVREVVMILTVGLGASGFYDVVKEPTKRIIDEMK